MSYNPAGELALRPRNQQRRYRTVADEICKDEYEVDSMLTTYSFVEFHKWTVPMVGNAAYLARYSQQGHHRAEFEALLEGFAAHQRRQRCETVVIIGLCILIGALAVLVNKQFE